MSDLALSGAFGAHGVRRLWFPEPLRRILRDLSDPYRPELHYMRGPGPKWRERHPDQLPGDQPASNCERLR